MISRIRSLPISTRIIAVAVFAMIVIVTVNYIVFINGYRESAIDAMVEKAAAFTAVANRTKANTSQQHRAGAFDTEKLLKDAKEAIASGRSYRETEFFRVVPVVNGWKAAEAAAKEEKLGFHILAQEPRHPDHLPKPGSFEEQMLADLRKQVEAGKGEVIHRIDKETNELRYMRAIKLDEGCMMCHGKPGNKWDTDGDGKDVLGFTMEGWAPGRMHGAYEIVMPLDTADAQVAAFIGNGLMWLLPLGAITVVLFVILMRRMLGQPISLLVNRITEIQRTNDLTQSVDLDRKDEIGMLAKAFNGLIGTLRNVIGEVVGASNEVAAAATEIAATSDEMATTIKEQTRETSHISSAIDQMSTAVVEVARRSSDASNTAQSAGEQATEGGKIVEQTVTGMEAIATVVSESGTTLEGLNERSQQIGQVMDLITEIADQTTLLALNAAIEAARAGQHGAGFAVVADEVRKLADRTMDATKEITEAIQGMQKDTTVAVKAMAQGTDRVNEGVQLAGSAGQALQSIVTGSRDVANMIAAIAAASEEQTSTAEEISRNVETINSVSSRSAEAASQASEAAEQLSRKAEHLQQMVNAFTIK